MTAGLRVALLGPSRFPIVEPFAGGLEAHVHALATSLADRGHRVTLFAAEGSSTPRPCDEIRVRHLDIARSPSVADHGPDLGMMPTLAEDHAYLSLMTELAGRPDEFDVVHNHSLHPLPIAMSSSLRRPMLTTLHTPPLPWLEPVVRAGSASGFAAVSDHTARQWRRVAGDVDVVHNGISPDEWPVGPGGGHAVWSGRIVPEKAPHLALHAATRAGVGLRLAGPIADPDYYDRQVRPLLGGSHRYLGHLRQQELARVVGSASVAIVTPVWDEPYGLVVAEALACGTPVAAFARGGIPEIITADCGRLAPAGDVSALTAALVDAGRLSRHAARRRAIEFCGADRMVERYIDVYTRPVTAVAG
ncbi:glycosyltransferase family 4 protein [Williamsia sterculiae]|uniref:Glycosyltransferase involved in cell wall bisynthesis n=1 Tax=Williamsia sterculiae TaxID=1344003 RepID=A0A1N7EPG8_9NOCA|nr:glycosyltransferase family 4 protein [Williamsia sterculiae]SIR89997.1 Glycosyltransferase involved in cell wall bisynthesis [Williamsia sterculiae]